MSNKWEPIIALCRGYVETILPPGWHEESWGVGSAVVGLQIRNVQSFSYFATNGKHTYGIQFDERDLVTSADHLAEMVGRKFSYAAKTITAPAPASA